MPPKKNGPKAPKVAKVAKAAVGRPRKKLGTRVSDVPVVSTIKPMPRRANIDSMALQRARLVYKRDYKKTISEDQARAFLDAMSDPKRGAIGTRILGPRDDARLRTDFISMGNAADPTFIELVKRAKTGFQKDKKAKVSLKVDAKGNLVLSVPGFEPDAVPTSGTISGSTVGPTDPSWDIPVADRHLARVQKLVLELGQLRDALKADPTNPGLLTIERRLKRKFDKERNVLRVGYPATASSDGPSTAYAASDSSGLTMPSSISSTASSSRRSSRAPSGYATPLNASENDIIAAYLEEPAAPAAAPVQAPAAAVEDALAAAPELVAQIAAEAPVARVTDPAVRPTRRIRSSDLIREVQRQRAEREAEEADLTARLNRLRDAGDPGPAADTLEAHAARLDPDGSLREIARLAELAQQRGPLPPPVAVSTSRRPSRQEAAQAAATALLTQVPTRRTAEEILYSRVLAAERQRAAEEAAAYTPEPGPEEEDEATRQRINARIRQRQIDEQAAELAMARARFDAANREIASRASSRRNRAIADAIVAQSNIPRSFGTVYDDIERDPSIPMPGRFTRDRQRLAQEAAYAILQPGTPVQSESRYATAPGSAYATAPGSVSGYATPAVQLERSFAELEEVPQDLLDMIEARSATTAALAEVRRQQAENERLYKQQERDKELLYLQNKALLEVETQRRIAEQAALELGQPVPVQRNIPTTTADAFSQGRATAFPSANIPVPPPPPPRPTGRPPRVSRNITDAELAAALAKGLKPTQGISSRELYATPREGGPPGLPPSVRSLPSAKDLQEATKRLKKLKPHVESGPLDVLLAPAVEPVNVPSTVNSEMAERLRKKFEGAQGKKDDEPWDDDVPKLVQGALTNLGVDPEIAKDEEFARAMEKKLSGTGLASKKFLKAVIKRARKTVKGGAMGGRMNDDRTDFRVLMDAMKNIRTGSGYFDGFKSLTYNIHGTPDDNKKDLAAAKAAYAAKGGRIGGSIVLSGVPTPIAMRGAGADADQYKLHFVAFPDDKWTTSSSLRWIRSNGIVPIKKALHIPEYYKYQILPPSDNKDYMTHELMSRGRKILLGYARPS